ncbi:MAG: hydrogenase expression/formation protein HypE [Acidimicrobiaceae bacterium]|nr:hydrogenase expression/formation protein HypE [Acidimicrobiaceae bacterium]MCY4174831.1 hydrogenase expression/formation protein HypE [Acidimicrobiaceae bacterium]MCY4281037.1 hydrogenase expression/formation protein HypE [Acidimicrobiaceae bacterium]
MAPNDDFETREAVLARIESWRRRPPKMSDETITMAHGAGGRASRSLIEAVIRPAFSNPALDGLNDAAVLDIADTADGRRLAVTTDAFVVTPRRFNGGAIGDLAVNGTINDLAAMGAEPLALTVSLVLEEGLPVQELREIVDDVARAAAAAGAAVVTGDTKVVERGAADGCYITTTGVGFVRPDSRLDAASVQPADALVLSGAIGDHGVAVMVARGDLAVAADVASDTAPLHELVSALLDAVPETRWLRDPTRGGVASACNELAADCGLGVELDERALPVNSTVAGACEMLGLDPLYIANEGKMLAVVPAEAAPEAVRAMQSCEAGTEACVVGSVTESHPGLVLVRTGFGGARIVDMLVGDPLPRIC